jgi:integrase
VSKVRIKHLQVWFDQRLKRPRLRLRLRRRGYKSIELPGPLGSPEFWRAYHAALVNNDNQIGANLRSKAGSISASIAAYYISTAWSDLSEGTQAMRRATLNKFRETVATGLTGLTYGELPVSKITENFVTAYLDRMKPHAARNTLKALRGWLRHAKHDVTRGITARKAISKKRPSWPAEEIARYEAHHAVGTTARLCFALARYTGAGRSEVARMGPRHVHNGEIVIARQKTGVEATIPIVPALQAVLDATPVTGLATFLVTKSGKAFAPNDLSEQFRAWADQAGVAPKLSLHGLRHTVGDALAETGSTPSEVASVLGHAGARSALHYTQGADRKRMARKAVARWISETR